MSNHYQSEHTERQKITPSSAPVLSVVAPCYNEANNISELCQRVGAACEAVVGMDYEIVLVNDGSLDSTWDHIIDAREAGALITAVNLSRNFGHQYALSAGLSVARGKYILVIDADLQDPPELLEPMMEAVKNGADVVYGQRTQRPGDSAIRKIASSTFYRLLSYLSDIDIPLDTGDFRMISRRVRDILVDMPEHDRYIRGMISWIGFRQEPIFYERDVRTQGETSYSLKRLMSFAADGITGFSIRPLRLSIVVGIFTAFLSFVYTAYIVSKSFIVGAPVAGWPSIMAVMLFLGGMQMIFLGLMGEYIGRLFMQSKGRPSFVIEDVRYSGSPNNKPAPKNDD